MLHKGKMYMKLLIKKKKGLSPSPTDLPRAVLSVKSPQSILEQTDDSQQNNLSEHLVLCSGQKDTTKLKVQEEDNASDYFAHLLFPPHPPTKARFISC